VTLGLPKCTPILVSGPKKAGKVEIDSRESQVTLQSTGGNIINPAITAAAVAAAAAAAAAAVQQALMFFGP